MLEEVLLMPKEIVHSASERGGNDPGKRKLIIDTAFLSGAVKHPAFICLDQIPSPLLLVLYPMYLFSLLEHSKQIVSSHSCREAE